MSGSRSWCFRVERRKAETTGALAGGARPESRGRTYLPRHSCVDVYLSTSFHASFCPPMQEDQHSGLGLKVSLRLSTLPGSRDGRGCHIQQTILIMLERAGHQLSWRPRDHQWSSVSPCHWTLSPGTPLSIRPRSWLPIRTLVPAAESLCIPADLDIIFRGEGQLHG